MKRRSTPSKAAPGRRSEILPYGHQWITEADIKEIAKVLRSDFITQGPVIEEFEAAVAGYCGVKYAVAVSSGSAALLAACRASV